MRIIAGSRRGRRLQTPDGRAVRPTADRVREALFNVLAHRDFGTAPLEGARVIELFAGTGALGLEALSRGAAHLTAIEHDPNVFAVLKANIAALDLIKQVRPICGDALHLPRAATPCAYAFLDAPYGSGLAEPALRALADAGWLAPNALAIVEMGAKETLEPPPGFAVLDERRYGAARIIFLRYVG